MNSVKELINGKRSKAETELRPVLREVWEKAIEIMAESSKLYPTVSLKWAAYLPECVELKCDGSTAWITISKGSYPMHLGQLVSYVVDVSKTEEFKNFSIEVHQPTKRHYEDGKEVIQQEEITATVKLKTLF